MEKIQANRRKVLEVAAIVAATQIINNGVNAMTANTEAVKPSLPPVGKIGEFNFLSGEWKIKHRKLKGGSKTEWLETEGGATCWHILGGLVSVEELRIPSWNFSGMGLRILDVEKKVWQDFWMNSQNGMLGTEPTLGVFVDGVGTWDSVYEENGKKTIWRGVWDRITADSHRWQQMVSNDEGKTWELNWSMDWTRANFLDTPSQNLPKDG